MSLSVRIYAKKIQNNEQILKMHNSVWTSGVIGARC